MNLRDLTDEQLTARIHECASEFIAAHERGDLNLAHEWYAKQCDALIERGQRPHIVAAMEADRGLS